MSPPELPLGSPAEKSYPLLSVFAVNVTVPLVAACATTVTSVSGTPSISVSASSMTPAAHAASEAAQSAHAIDLKWNMRRLSHQP